ncbi:TPA: hypothetical protein ACH3X1_004668 [Trebouxia sp. C0004]
MGFFTKALLVLLVFAFAGLIYVAKLAVLYIGMDILNVGWRLFRQGSLKFGRLALRPYISIRNFQIVEPKSAGGDVLFSANLSVVESPLRGLFSGNKVVVAVHEATMFLHLDSNGSPRWMNLLAAVDAVKDVEATLPAPVSLEEGNEGDTRKSEKESESASMSDKKFNRRFSLSKSSKSTKVKSSRKLSVVPYKRVPFTADVSAYILRLYLRESLLELPEHAALIVGDNLKVKGALGLPNVALYADAAPGYDSAWCSNADHWPTASTTTGRPLYPIVLDAQAENCTLHVQGWRTTTGLLLQQPISMSLNFTPALAKFALREMHPLLGSAVGLQGDSSLHMTLEPLQLHLPADCYTVRIQPMKLVIGSNAFLSSIMGLLKLNKMQSTNVEAWTSTVEADIFQNGQIISKRMDVLLGSSLGSCKGVHVIMWGHVDTVDDVLDMTLGIPADTLAATGIKELPSDYVLPVPVKGTPQAPNVNWGRAVGQLTELSIKRQVTKGLPWLSNVISSFGGPSLDMTDYSTAPPLVGKLPWEAQDAQHGGVALGADLTEL